MSTNPLKIKYTLLPGAKKPEFQSQGAACCDLHAVLPEGQMEQLDPGHAMTFNTGIALEIPPGHVGLIFSRSGQGFKDGIQLANSVGVIDCDFRGEICVRLVNLHKNKSFNVADGTRIAQLMILPIPAVELVEASDLSETERGAGGFGSTGA